MQSGNLLTDTQNTEGWQSLKLIIGLHHLLDWATKQYTLFHIFYVHNIPVYVKEDHYSKMLSTS